MPTLITPDYFIGEISITGHEQNKAAREKLCLFISQFEFEFLLHALGYDFMQAFLTGVAGSDAAFTRLRDGGNFTLADGKKAYLYGLAKEPAAPSPLANYIYYWFQRSTETQTTSTGEVNTETEKARIASANAKAVRAWNVAARYCRALWNVLENAVSEDGARLYPGFDMSSVDKCHFETINQFGI